MGFYQKKDEDNDVIEGVEVIGRGEGPDGLEENPIDLVSGESAEDIASGVTAEAAAEAAEAQKLADAQDDALMEGIAELEDEDTAAEEPADADESVDEDTSEANSQTTDDEESAQHHMHMHGHGHACECSGNHHASKKLSVIALAAVVLVVLAGVCGYFIGSSGSGVQGTGTSLIEEKQLDTTVARWTFKGKSHQVSAREAIEVQYSLERAKNADNKYQLPSTETVIGYVRNKILLSEAESRGLSATDDEMKTYAEKSVGTSDYDQMAKQYGLTKDQAKDIVRQNTIISKLYEEIAPKNDAGAAPEAPAEPENGDKQQATKDYASYIINLAGKEWDSEKGTWASQDGPYFKALGKEEFSAESATYAQAQSAYYVAYQQYLAKNQNSKSTWQEFANKLYSEASVTVSGLYV
ncbi:hypothetical protein KPC83_05860 [Collinsella sp. zg1085]|uniref:hypothetical protein n=1 Tax=Collinsella sp. zg1085 TaxID=2844380 RepID=UPI001C0C8378|nr:hypothetical protein [Collinsella sp. zg1085]QWT17362.1 hypothetical protein KPC83_05860 [Collinsella sp. zg1085]